MLPQLCFFASIAFSFIAWGFVASRYIWPDLRLRHRADALRPLLTLHSFRFVGLAFLVPGVVSPDLPSAFAHAAAYGDLIAAMLAVLSLLSLRSGSGCAHRMDLQSLGLSRYPERFLPGQSRRALAGPVGSRLLPSHVHRADPADYARTRFPNSSATSKRRRSTGKPVPGLTPLRGLRGRMGRAARQTTRVFQSGLQRWESSIICLALSV